MPAVEKYVRKNRGDLDDARDVFHDALLKFMVKVKEQKEEVQDIQGYIFISARNNWITKVTRDNKFTYSEYITENEFDEGSEPDLEQQEKVKLMKEVLNSLGERCKDLLTLTFYLDYSLKDAAKKLGISSDEVAKTNQYRCKKKLFEKIKNNKAFIEHYL